MRSSSWNGKVALAFCSGLSAASKRLAVSVITETVWTWLCIPLWAWLFWPAIRPPPKSVADELRNERRWIWHISSSRHGRSARRVLHRLDLNNQITDFGESQARRGERAWDGMPTAAEKTAAPLGSAAARVSKGEKPPSV